MGDPDFGIKCCTLFWVFEPFYGGSRFWKRIRVLSPLIGIIFPIEASNIKIYADRNRITHIEMLHTQLEVQMLNVVSLS